jgi:3-oxoacyl-[acyl-carrier-protein] synthase II
MNITIQGIGVVGGFGCGVQDLARAMDRDAGPAPTALRIDPTALRIDPAALRADPSALDRFVPRRGQRRMDRLSRLAALAAHLALEDAGALADDHSRLGLVLASGFGATGTTLALIDSIIEGGDPCASPIHFAGSLHNAAAAHLAILLGARGPSLTVSQFHLSVGSALLAARLWLDQGRVDRVLFGAVDELSELTGHLWARQGELERPLGPAGAPPGEGAACFLLSSRAEAQPAYAILERVDIGRGSPPPLPGHGLVLLSGGPADLPGTRLLPLYGSMPAAPAFDLAAAAILVRRGAPRVNCLSLTDDDEYALVSARRMME